VVERKLKYLSSSAWGLSLAYEDIWRNIGRFPPVRHAGFRGQGYDVGPNFGGGTVKKIILK
jgi:hypothetical protein